MNDRPPRGRGAPSPPARGHVLLDLTMTFDAGSTGEPALLGSGAMARAMLMSTLAAAGLQARDVIRQSDQAAEERRAHEREALLKTKLGRTIIPREPDAKKSAGGSCIICTERIEKRNAFVPCGHECACDGCAREIVVRNRQRCPICDAKICQILPLYDATA